MTLPDQMASSLATAQAPELTTGHATPQRRTFRLSDLWRAPMHDFPIRNELLYQYLPLAPRMDVLEIGPGSGYTAYILARRVRGLTLIDVAAENAARLKQALQGIPNVTVICADVCAPNLQAVMNRQFDAIFGLEIFEYLPDPGTCLKNLAGLLRPGGNLLLEFPNYPPPKSPGITHFRKREELDRLLQVSGFQSWEVYALKLHPHARFLFQTFHERPLRILRALRNWNHRQRALTYDQTWAFRRGSRLERHKFFLHLAWAVLGAAMHLGGDCFERTLLEKEILNHDLLVAACR